MVLYGSEIQIAVMHAIIVLTIGIHTKQIVMTCVFLGLMFASHLIVVDHFSLVNLATLVQTCVYHTQMI